MTDIDEWIARTPAGRALVVGAGSLAVMVADAIVATGRCGFDAVAMVDDDASLHGSQRHGMPVLGAVDLAAQLAGAVPTETGVVVAVASNAVRELLVDRLPGDLPWLTVIHPGVTVSPLASIGVGSVVLAGTAIDPECSIGRHVIVNKLCSLGHNCTLDEFVQLAPMVASGGTHGRGSFTGMGANVLPGVRIGATATVGAGALVKDDVPDGVTVVGVPAAAR